MRIYITLALVATTYVIAYDQSLTDCEAFAALFENTCTSGPVNNSDVLTTSEVTAFTCTGNDSWCVGQDQQSDSASASCDHNQFTCVTCAENSGVVEIRYQSNNMPAMCWQTTGQNPNTASYQNVDFTVTWNADVTDIVNYPESYFETADDVSSTLCDINRTAESNMLDQTTYTENGSSISMGTVAGFGRQNIALYNGLAAGNLDAVLTEYDSMDQCLSHAPSAGVQHAHSIVPCLNGAGITGSTTDKPGDCSGPGTESNTICWEYDTSFAYQGWTTDDGTYGGIYGIARDGHVIYGPYNADGEIWGCEDVDRCNGFFLADGSYGYASTTFFPYLVGCWGPGATHNEFEPDCTDNGCSTADYESSGDDSAIAGISFVGALFTATFALVTL